MPPFEEIAGDARTLRFDVEREREILDSRAEAVLRAGEALGLIDVNGPHDDYSFRHQLIQEHFAVRRLAEDPDPSVARVEWRANRIFPHVEEVIAELAPADPLPSPPTSGWEETLRFAVSMAENPLHLLGELQAENLALAGQIANEQRQRDRAIEALVPPLHEALVERSGHPAADLRHQIACGRALGELGDPRIERHQAPRGDFLLPPMVEVAGGRYPIGAHLAETAVHTSDVNVPDATPVHEVVIAPFALGRFPVTNAEWCCFVESGGHKEGRWWQTSAARLATRTEHHLRHQREHASYPPPLSRALLRRCKRPILRQHGRDPRAASVANRRLPTRRHTRGHHGSDGQCRNLDLELLQLKPRRRPGSLSLHRRGWARGGGTGPRSSAHRSWRHLEPSPE